MERDFIPDDNKEYVHEEAKTLLKEVRDFFRGKLKMVNIEWVSNKKVMINEELSSGSEVFVIKNAKEAPFERCKEVGDVDGILTAFEVSLNNLMDNIDSLVDNNKNLDTDTKASIESYASAVDKAVRVFGIQRKRRMTKITKLSAISEIRDELKQLISEIMANYIILVLIDALYCRVKNGSGEIYELAVSEVNNFLMENGVVTKNVKIGEIINSEYMELTPDSRDNVTDEFVKFNTIEEIRRYPYYFSDGTKILDGLAKIWRHKD